MRHRIEIVTESGTIHRSVCRSWPSAWRAVQRELDRDGAARIRVLREDDASGLRIEEALIEDGRLVVWHGRRLAEPLAADAAPRPGR